MIIGAGLAGMVAAHVFPREEIHEAHEAGHIEHQAVLRFRTSAISELTGIPFRRVIVRKGIWLDSGWSAPTISASNAYSQKVVGCIADRSIWDIGSAERWVPPEEFHPMLWDLLGRRIHWRSTVPMSELRTLGVQSGETIISTMPLPTIARELLDCRQEFPHSPILTTSCDVPGSSVYQTVYFPDERYALYRATLSGARLTCEWTGKDKGDDELACRHIACAFGSEELGWRAKEAMKELHVQEFGKLLPINEVLRKNLVLKLTNQFGIFSLGRFATWRNLLLDDVAHDAAIIKQLATATAYERRLATM